MRLIFVGQGYPRKLFDLEHFPIYGSYLQMCLISNSYVHTYLYVHVYSKRGGLHITNNNNNAYAC